MKIKLNEWNSYLKEQESQAFGYTSRGFPLFGKLCKLAVLRRWFFWQRVGNPTHR